MTIVDETLAPGLAANAVGVLAVTLGATLPELIGAELVDANGISHPGLITTGLPVLAATQDALGGLRDRAHEAELGVIDLPSQAQQTTDYQAFSTAIASLSASEMRYLGLVVYGPSHAVRKITGQLSLLR